MSHVQDIEATVGQNDADAGLSERGHAARKRLSRRLAAIAGKDYQLRFSGREFGFSQF